MSEQQSYKIILKNVRLSFPAIWQKNTKFGGDNAKYKATFLIHKDEQADLIKKIEDKIAAIQKETKVKVSKDKLCLKDGDDAEYDGYADHMSLKAANSKRPTILDRDKTPLIEDDNKPYAGCYVNASVQLWVQNNDWGKRVNANLLGIQFFKDGEPFGAGDLDATDDFDDFSDDDDDDDYDF